MEKKNISGIGRPVDPNYSTNRAITIISIIVFAGSSILKIVTRHDFFDSLLWGFQVGITVFLSWALSREIDPDYNVSAFIAAGLSLIGVFYWGIPALGVIFWLLLAVRIMNRITGLPVTILDSIVFITLSAWLSYQVNWGIGLVATIVLLADILISSRKGVLFIFPFLSMFFTWEIFQRWGVVKMPGEFIIKDWIIVLVLCLVFLSVIIRTRKVNSMCDTPGEVPVPLRIQLGQIVVLLVGLEVMLWNGKVGMIEMFPLWLSVLAVSIYAGLIRIVPKLR